MHKNISVKGSQKQGKLALNATHTNKRIQTTSDTLNHSSSKQIPSLPLQIHTRKMHTINPTKGEEEVNSKHKFPNKTLNISF